MKVTDLMVGNYVVKLMNFNQREIVRLTFRHLDLIERGIWQVGDIVIHGMWLIRFGFSYTDGYYRHFLLQGHIREDEGGWNFYTNEEKVNTSPLKYIHQLQNFFHSLTGMDLHLQSTK